MWLERVYDILGRLNTLPVLTYKMDDMERFYRARMARDSCGLNGVLTYTNGTPTFVDVSANEEVCEGFVHSRL